MLDESVSMESGIGTSVGTERRLAVPRARRAREKTGSGRFISGVMKTFRHCRLGPVPFSGLVNNTKPLNGIH